jgi:hypothetical protein
MNEEEKILLGRNLILFTCKIGTQLSEKLGTDLTTKLGNIQCQSNVQISTKVPSNWCHPQLIEGLRDVDIQFFCPAE